MSRINTLALLCGASLAVLGLSSAAFAQAQESASSRPAGTAAADSDQVGEIIVTAQRRAENVQDVPVTVAVVGARELAQRNIVTTTDLVQAVPALTVTNFGVFQIRSLGTQGFGRSAEQSVSVVLDGVALPRPQAYELGNAMFDVERVEVLSGPQGTLFGKNASAGVISIVTKAPRLGAFEASAHLDAGDHDFRSIQGVVNVPLGQTAALRLVAHRNTTGHIVYNTLFGKWDRNVDDGVRGRLRWEPTDTLSVNLFGDYQRLHSNGVNGIEGFAGVGVYRFAPPGSVLESRLAACGIVASPSNRKVCADSLYAPGVDRGNVYGGRRGGGSAQIDWEFGQGYTLTSITAYRRNKTGDSSVDGDFAGGLGDTLPINLLQRNLFPSTQSMFSEELRVQSPADDPINFVAGLYYSSSDRRDHTDQAGTLGADLGGSEYRRVNDIKARAINYAAFGQVNLAVSSAFRLFAGARVTRDRVRVLSINSFPTGPFVYTGNKGFFSLYPISTCTLAGGDPDAPATCPAGTSLSEPGRLSETGVTWKVGGQYDLSAGTMAYATVTRGYKGPFINDQASFPITPPQLVVKSEAPMAYELGLKSRVARTVYANVALFYNKTKDFQTTIYVPPSSTNGVANYIQGNAPHAVTKGVDASVFGNLGKSLSFNGSLLYNKAHFNSGFIVNCASGPCAARSQLPYAPRWKATLGGEYHRDLSDSLQGFLQSDFSYAGSSPYGSSPDTYMSGARYVLGGRLGVRADDERFSLALFCRNCLDKRYPLSVSEDGLAVGAGGAGPPVAQVQYLGLSSYRVVGLTLDARF